MNIIDFQNMKLTKNKITVVTCYDYWSAKIIAETNIDCVLVGDSAAMVMHGYETTVHATVEMMATHTAAVTRGVGKKFLIGDMPFLSYRKNFTEVLNAAEKIMRAGAHAIKLEGADGNLQLIHHLTMSGIPVMGHLGLTPQSVHQLGGMRVQGKTPEAGEIILSEALQLQEAGCFAVVLECVPALLAQKISQALNIPTIGIGAGPHTDGQVLVLHDLLGFNSEFKPKFLKTYLDGHALVKHALNQYNNEVKAINFPAEEHCFSGS